MKSTQISGLQSSVLTWGDANLRELPWRSTRDPWAVLVAEVMLQQTQVDRVLTKYPLFMERFPTTQRCAAQTPGDVIAAWSGLGYNRRALFLHRAATAIETEHGGAFPASVGELQRLPGVGAYTARAIMAFAFERDEAPVDTNIGRLLARWSGSTLRPAQAQALASKLVPVGQGWAWNQTLMDFATALCSKRAPECTACPVHPNCTWRGVGPDPAVASAGVSSPQSRFIGSDRQGRARLVALLGHGALDRSCVAEVMGWPDDAARAERVLRGLVEDGMVVERGPEVRLTGGLSTEAVPLS